MSNLTKTEEDALVAQVAALVRCGVPEVRIAEELGVTRYRVSKIRGSEAYKAYLKEISDKASREAISDFVERASEMTALALAALQKNLEEGKIEGVRLWAETIGLKKLQDQAEDKGMAPLQIVLPGANVPAVKDITVEVEDK